MLKAQIVADRGKRRAVGGERQRSDGRAVLDVAHRELGGEVLRIAGAAAIAEKEQLAARADRRRRGFDERAEGRLAVRERGAHHRLVLGKLALEELLEVHAPPQSSWPRRLRRPGAWDRSSAMATASLERRRALILDRDGVVNEDSGYLHRIEDCRFVEGIFALTNAFARRHFA